MIAFVGDQHVWNFSRYGGQIQDGINARGQDCLDVLARARAAAGTNTLVLLGDFFDRTRPEPQLIAAARDVLLKGGGYNVILKGNHDSVSIGATDHALGPLTWPDRIQVVAEPKVVQLADADLLCVPHAPVDPEHQLASACSLYRLAPQPRLLAFHAGIKDGTMPSWQRALRAVRLEFLSHLMVQHGIQAAFAGDWHDGRDWTTQDGRAIHQLGTLCPKDHSDSGTVGRLLLWDRTTTRFSIIPGPRFVQDDLSLAESLTPIGNVVYFRSHVEADRVDETRAVLLTRGFRNVEILPIGREAERTTSGHTTVDLRQAVERSARDERVAALALQYLERS